MKNIIKRMGSMILCGFLCMTPLNLSIYAQDTEVDVIQEQEPSVPEVQENLNQEQLAQEEIEKEVPMQEEVLEQEAQPAQEEVKEVLPGDINKVKYFLVDKPYLETPQTQTFVLSFDPLTMVSSMSIFFAQIGQEEVELLSSMQVDGLFKFEKQFNENETGLYTVNAIQYVENDTTYRIDFSSLGMEVKFGVNQKYEELDELVDLESAGQEGEEIPGVAQIDVANPESAATSIEETLLTQDPGISVSTFALGDESKQGELVIALDPGHGGWETGGVAVNGTPEKDTNLKIANYCKEELETYKGVRVVMTRTSNVAMTLEERVDYAKKQGASVIVSLHTNGLNGTHVGAEVYYPNNNYRPDISTEGKQLAQQIQNQLVALGIYDRGIKVKYIYDEETGQPTNDPKYDYPDGSIGDYYGIIRHAKNAGMVGLIVEHCFHDNASDFNNFMNSDAKLKKLGVADATGIAKTYGLSKTGSSTSDKHFVAYQTHIQGIGWQSMKYDGAMSGTSGQSKRLEGIKISLPTLSKDGGIEYATHVQGIGWQGWKANGEMSGTSGQSKRLEAIRIRLTGAVAQKYDVYYRVHAQQLGWLDWAKNGQDAGSAGYSYRLEGIEIRLVNKGGNAPGSTSRPFVQRLIGYQTHVQNYGWQEVKYDGAMAGTSGQSKRLEGIKITLPSLGDQGGVQYATHVQTYGWQGWKTTGQMSGTSGQSKRLEAIKIRLTGSLANLYDVYYRVHAQQFGWLDWAKNGQEAGTAGYSYRLEGIEIRLVSKGGKAPGSTAKPFYDKNSLVNTPSKPAPKPPVNNETLTPIMGASNVTVDQMVSFFKKNNPNYDVYANHLKTYNGILKSGGASTIESYCQIFLEEANAEGVRAEIAFAQAMLETGFLRFGGDVKPDQYNFAGLGATGGVPGNRFPNVRIGIRAHIQHLKCYASTQPLNTPKVDPRWSDSLRGKAAYVEYLSTATNPNKVGWASSPTYAEDILKLIDQM